MATEAREAQLDEDRLDTVLRAAPPGEPDGPYDCSCCADRRAEELEQRRVRSRREEILLAADQLIPAADVAAALIGLLRAVTAASRIVEELAERHPADLVIQAEQVHGKAKVPPQRRRVLDVLSPAEIEAMETAASSERDRF